MPTLAGSISQKLFEINANWTSLEKLGGWKHFRIAGRRKDAVGQLELEMMAVCDRHVRVWVSREKLVDSASWKPGWLDS